MYRKHSDWDSESDDDNTSSEREELPTIIPVDRLDKKVDALMCDCVTVVKCFAICVSVSVRVSADLSFLAKIIFVFSVATSTVQRFPDIY